MKIFQQILLVALGVVIGLLLGVVVIQPNAITEETVRAIVAENNTQLLDEITVAIAELNTANPIVMRRNLDPATSSFFLVTMDQTAEWLETFVDAEGVEFSGDVLDSVLAANGIQTSADLELYFRQQVNTVDGVLANVYHTLQSVLGDADADVNVCLGLDSDPYSVSGPVIYLYLQLPQDGTEALPKDWHLLSGPREDSMLWSAECYDPQTAVETLEG